MTYERARFVDRDGRSFFSEVGPNRGVWLRQELEPQFWPDGAPRLELRSDEQVKEWTGRVEEYHREVWVVLYGPLACPAEIDGGVVDVVYRFVGVRERF